MAFPKSKSMWVHFSVLSLLTIAQCGIPSVMVTVSCVLIFLWVTFSTIYYMCKKPAEAAPSAPLLPSSSGEDKAPSVAPSGKKERLYYLDNLKIFLTAVVILHHQTCSFVGNGWYFNIGNYSNSFQAVGNALLAQNQSYFMCAFFFISGYFTPTSFDRKGHFLFLRDKFKRLGIPYVTFCLVLAGLLGLIYQAGAHHDVKWEPTPNPGPLWFVGWLLVFNTAYANTDHSTPNVMSCPTPSKMLLWCFFINILNWIVMIFGGGTFAYMPLTFGSLPFDVMHFYGGCIAKRNRWLESGVEGGIIEIMDKHRKKMYSTIAFFSVAMFGYSIYYQQSTPADDYDEASNTPSLIGLFVISWLFISLMLFCQLDFFRNHFNSTGKWSKILSGAAYTAYIIHPFFVCSMTAAFVAIYEASTGETLVFEDGRTDSETVLDSDAWLWGGWAVCTLLSVTLTFFFAYWIRELVPGAKQII